MKKIEIQNEECEIGYDIIGECELIEEIRIGEESIKEYSYEITYEQMKEIEKKGITSTNVVIRREDVEKYGIEIIQDDRVKRIADNCFRGNQEIIEMDIPTHITSLGLYSYSGCSNLRRITIPTSITYIPSYCFEHCTSLEDITIPTSISYGSKCFHCCSSLSDESRQYIPNDLITFEEE